jgi:hypothetical protein
MPLYYSGLRGGYTAKEHFYSQNDIHYNKAFYATLHHKFDHLPSSLSLFNCAHR